MIVPDQARPRPHAHRYIARHLFRPAVADRGWHDSGVIGGINHRQGRGRRAAAKQEGRHLNLGEGAAHAVAIDSWDAGLQSGDQGLHGIGAADLGDGNRIELPPDMFF